MMRLAFDGSQRTGTYRVDCECGTNWSGQAEPAGVRTWSPALPVAESIVHMRLTHDGDSPELRFTHRFSDWLEQYWEKVNASRATGLEYSRRSVVQ